MTTWRSLPRQETLARRRREIQEAREDLRPTERVKKKRQLRQLAYMHNYTQGTLTLLDAIGGEAVYDAGTD
jgi:hypothetical protein